MENNEEKLKIVKAELDEEFAKYGKVLSVEYRSGWLGPSIVIYSTEEEADKAFEALRGKTFTSKVVKDYKLFVRREDNYSK